MDLGTLANLAEIFGALTVVGGVVFAAVQMRQYRQQRSENAAIELVRSFQTPELLRAFSLLRLLPDGISAEELRGKGSEYEDAAITICGMYETVGLLVFKGMLPLAIVHELAGGLVSVLWRKLGTWVEETRAETSHEKFLEWFQWLVEQLDRAHAKSGSQPAYERFASWRPRR